MLGGCMMIHIIHIPANSEVGITVLCHDCGTPLDIDYKQDLNGDIEIYVDPCSVCRGDS